MTTIELPLWLAGAWTLVLAGISVWVMVIAIKQLRKGSDDDA